jgi:pimeloyl-ACP methyl ester carboxylesterase
MIFAICWNLAAWKGKNRVIMNPESSFATCSHGAGAHRLHYLQWGDRPAPTPVFCVHALTRRADDFMPLAQALAPRTVVAPDMVGRGQSPWLLDSSLYSYPHYINDCIQLLNKLGLLQVDWVGTSMGGLIGMSIAAMHPGRIRKLVLNDVGPFLPLTAIQRIGAYLDMAPVFADAEQAYRYCRTVYAPFGLKSEEEWRDFTARSIRQKKDGSWCLHYDPRLGDLFKSVNHDVNLWPAYDRVQCPVLVLRGASSDVLKAEDAIAMTRRGPKAQLITFEGVGHAPALAEADQIAAVQMFLD